MSNKGILHGVRFIKGLLATIVPEIRQAIRA